MNPSVIAAAAAFALALIFPAALIYLFSRVSGWSALAKHYPAREPAPQPRKRSGSAVFRHWIGYNGAIVISSDARGLFLAGMPVILSFCHAPIFIPWSEIREIRRTRSFMSEGWQIDALKAPDVQVMLRPSTFEFVRRNAAAAVKIGEGSEG